MEMQRHHRRTPSPAMPLLASQTTAHRSPHLSSHTCAPRRDHPPITPIPGTTQCRMPAGSQYICHPMMLRTCLAGLLLVAADLLALIVDNILHQKTQTNALESRHSPRQIHHACR